jgi:hypothetical protein
MAFSKVPLTGDGAAMLCHRSRDIAVRILLAAVLFFPCRKGWAQAGGAKSDPSPALPISLEWNESFHPLAQSKLAVDSFQLRGGSKNLKLQFSTQAPGILAGRQFLWAPGGYQLADFSFTRKWGSIHGFQSLRYDSKRIRPAAARVLTGGGIDLPKSILGTSLAAYYLHASPSDEARQANDLSLTGSRGAQIGLALARDFKKKARLQAEWTESRHESRLSLSKIPPGFFGGARRAFMVGFEGTLARTEFSSALITRDEGLANPAVPSYGPAQRDIRLNARRKFKGHQIQYSVQSNGQRALPLMSIVSHDIMEYSAGWSYAPKRLPQFTAIPTLCRQTVAGRREEERGFRLSLAKTFRRINASLGFFRAARTDMASVRRLWQRTVLSGDAAIEIRKGNRLHFRYEANALEQLALSQKASYSSLQMDTRLGVWKDRLSLSPALDLQRQRGTLPAQRQLSARAALSAAVRLPRRIPGSDLLISLASNHTRSAGRPDWNHIDLAVRWNFKRF